MEEIKDQRTSLLEYKVIFEWDQSSSSFHSLYLRFLAEKANLPIEWEEIKPVSASP